MEIDDMPTELCTPENIIATTLDNGQSAQDVMKSLDRLGYVIVPKEPTREMWAAGADAVVGKVTVHHDKIVGDAWAAMLEKAPR